MKRQKMSKKVVAITLEERKCLDLRLAGATYDQIAETLGLTDKKLAWRRLDSALRKTIAEPAEKVRRVELARLDAMLVGLWKPASEGHLGSIDRVLKIQERRAKLLGLDAPTKTALTDTSGKALAPALVMLPDDGRDGLFDDPDDGDNGGEPGKAVTRGDGRGRRPRA